MVLLPVEANPKWRPAAMLINYKWPYLSNGSFIMTYDYFIKFYTDLGTEEHNKVCTQDVP